MIKTVFKRFILEENLIEKGDGIVVALSGGADSVFMTEMLLEIKDEMDMNLVCVHLNHLFRGEDADADEAFCKTYCEERELNFISKRLNISKMAEEAGLTFEEMGRRERYKFFEEIRLKLGYQRIAVAQNLDDQGETMLLHLFRGSGLKGLAGILPKRGDIIRPILAIGRESIENYLTENAIGYCTDKTNFETIYSRNFLRLSLLKDVKEKLNPQVSKTLFTTSRLIQCDEDYMNVQVEKVIKDIVVKSEDSWEVDLEDWSGQHLSIKRRLIRKIILDFTGNLQNIHHYIIDEIIELCNNGMTGKHKPVNEAITFSIKYGKIVITSGIYENIFEDKRGLHLDIRPVGDLKGDIDYDAYIDYDLVKEGLTVRYRRNGDRFRPFGMSGTKKLKDHFINLKIPREERARIPLICDGESIVWIVGYGISDQYKVSGNTKKVAYLSYR